MSSSPSTPAIVWPSSTPELATLLAIERYDKGRCSGYASKKPVCNNILSADSITEINQLLFDVVQAEQVTERVLRNLTKLSSLVLCRKSHQEQAAGKKAFFEQVLSTIPATNGTGGPQPPVDDDEHPAPPNVEVEQNDNPTAQDSRRSHAVLRESPASTQPPRRVTRSSTHPLPIPSPEPSTTNHAFIPSGPLLSTLTINKNIKSRLGNTSIKDMKEGYVYIYVLPPPHTITFFSEPSSPGSEPAAPFLKIGYAADVPERLRKWQKLCGYHPVQRFMRYAPRARTAERLVQLSLKNAQRYEEQCPKCHGKHVEWYDTPQDEAERLIKLWCGWLLKEPYEAGTNVLKPYWRSRLDAVDLSQSSPWERFVRGREEPASRSISPVRELSPARPRTARTEPGPTPARRGRPAEQRAVSPPPVAEQPTELADEIDRLSPEARRFLADVVSVFSRHSARDGAGSRLHMSSVLPLLVAAT